MLRLGLTGGIATGKSTVANILLSEGVIILDADQIAHKNMKPTGLAYPGILEFFGPDILDKHDLIDRKKLGATIFSSEQKRLKLNQLTHPYVRDVLQEKTREYQELEASNQKKYILVLMIPLLFESELSYLVDQTMVVYCPEEVQLSRLMQRNQLSSMEAEQRIRAQMPIETKARRADFLIDNSQSPEFTRQQVIEWLGKNTWDPYFVQP